jgi:hypothetical protein
MSTLKKLKNAQRHQKLRTGIIRIEIAKAHNQAAKRILETTAADLSKDKLVKMILWSMKSRINMSEVHVIAESIVRKIRDDIMRNSQVSGSQLITGFTSEAVLHYSETQQVQVA